MRAPLTLLLVAFSAWQTQAVTFVLASAGPPTWTYNINFAANDNYNISTSSTTITLTGLSGVISATGPMSTDFPAGSLNTNNLAWVPQVLNGGTKVVWTNSVGGTGNFPGPKNIFGFTVTAPGAFNGNVSISTNGFSRDPSPSLDFTSVVQGPSSVANATTPLPTSWILALTGMGAAAAFQARSRLAQLFKR